MSLGGAALPGSAPVVSSLRRVPVELVVFAVALAARTSVVLRSGGFLGNYGYDTSVYYAAADALIHGRMPYRDFVLLHPPGLMLAVTPFALLGRLTTDHIGYAGANLGFSVVGALTAVLVVRVVKTLGLGARGAAVGGLFYAGWFTSVSAEFSARLEPLGNLFLAAGLYAVILARARRGWPLFALAGAAMGLAMSVKIWFVVPLVVVAAWLVVVERRPRVIGAFLAGAVAACLVIDGPFLFLARAGMWSMVVSDQLGRHRMTLPLLDRLTQVTSTSVARHVGPGGQLMLVVAAGLVLVAVLVLAWRTNVARVMVVLVLVQLAVLIASPSYFGFYGDYLAVALSVTVAAAAVTLAGRARWIGWLPTLAAGAVTLTVVITGRFGATSSWHGAGRMIASVSHLRCVMSDAPSGLIELNALDRNLANGCRNWVDVTGRTYFGVDSGTMSRRTNPRWQRDLRSYLLSGDAVFLVRIAGTGLNPATLRIIASGGVLDRADGYRVYHVGVRANVTTSH